jgi:hypothetical protein
MSALTITGEMFTISIEGPRAEIRIFRRPDLDSETGAKNAARISEEAGRLAGRGVRAVLLDLRDAPAIAGPKSVASMGAMMAGFAAAHMRVAILVPPDDAMKVLQFSRVVTEHAPRDARVIKDATEATKWLAATR